MKNSLFKKSLLVTAISASMMTAGYVQADQFDECPAEAFLVQGKKASVYGVDLVSGFAEVKEDSLNDNVVNAVGFNNHDDFRYLYGWSKEHKKPVRIEAVKDGNGNVTDYDMATFNVSGSGAISNIDTSHFYVGDVSLAHNAYYVYRNGGVSSSQAKGLIKIPLDQTGSAATVSGGQLSGVTATAEQVTTGTSPNLTIFDIAFHPNNGNLYTVDKHGKLYIIELDDDGDYVGVSSGMQLKISDGNGDYSVTKGTFGAIYFSRDDKDNDDASDDEIFLYYSLNSNGYIYKIDPSATPETDGDGNEFIEASIFSYGPSSSQNDGARCALAKPQGDDAPTSDFGSAPVSYGTKLSDSGANHRIVNGLHLGSGVDAEEDAYAFDENLSPPVTDDDIASTASDNPYPNDGVQFLSALVEGESTLVNVNVATPDNGSYTLNGWIDFNENGVFDSSEKVLDQESVSDGSNLFSITTAGLSATSQGKKISTWARFRLSSDAGIGATAGTTDGEVEDYLVDIEPCSSCEVTDYPSTSGWVTFAYEDLWPRAGSETDTIGSTAEQTGNETGHDYDLNDIVVFARHTSYSQNDGTMVGLTLRGSISANGATYRNGFAIALPNVARADIDEDNIVYKVNGVVNSSLESSALEATKPDGSAISEAIIVIAEDVKEELLINDACGEFFRTTDCADPIDFNYEIYVPFNANSDVQKSDLGSLALNPFIFGTPTPQGGDEEVYDRGELYPDFEYGTTIQSWRELEVHLKGKEPTEVANAVIFGRSADNTNEGANRYYMTKEGLPFGFEIGSRWFKHPYETQNIIDAYPTFPNYVLSDGEEDQDWHQNPVEHLVFPH